MISGISDRATFARIRSEGQHVRSADLRLRYLDTAGDVAAPIALAYSISRKVGGAVVRNRIRRRLRAIFAELLDESQEPSVGAAVVIVLPGAGDRSYAELKAQVLELMKKIEKSRNQTT